MIEFRALIASALPALLAAIGTLATEGDWPQFRGPGRDAKSTETGLLRTWPEGGPRQLWSVDQIAALTGAKVSAIGERPKAMPPVAGSTSAASKAVRSRTGAEETRIKRGWLVTVSGMRGSTSKGRHPREGGKPACRRRRGIDMAPPWRG